MVFLILGCGWVGTFFGQKMLNEGHQVYATTTRENKWHDLTYAGMHAIQADFDGEICKADFPPSVDYVLNSIPATQRLEGAVVRARFQTVQDLLSSVSYKKHIFLSSVGIYPDEDGIFTEEFPIDRNQNLYLAETSMLQLGQTLVYRLGGLFGGDRIFAKYFEGRICTTGEQRANFIHRNDVAALIQLGFLRPLASSVYNLVTPEHPLKADVVLASAARHGFSLPSGFNSQSNFQKVVSGERIVRELGYTFLYKSPLHF
ncbi:MAG TPA: NAD-dependent epimerase/dehydratase family protein [Sphingobacterium sp.]|jgi:nucleoside-diphosphate-sugar epimerase|nr:NAD-dependent epimerase/dehydratase family protein [Sphingobacterium sp.]